MDRCAENLLECLSLIVLIIIAYFWTSVQLVELNSIMQVHYGLYNAYVPKQISRITYIFWAQEWNLVLKLYVHVSTSPVSSSSYLKKK